MGGGGGGGGGGGVVVRTLNLKPHPDPGALNSQMRCQELQDT